MKQLKLIIVMMIILSVTAAVSAETYGQYTQSRYGFGVYTESSLQIRELIIDQVDKLSVKSVTRSDIADIVDCTIILSTQNQLDFYLVLSIIATESNFNASAISCAGSYNGRGLMQVSEIALKDYNRVNRTHYKSKDLFDIEINILIGIWSYLQNASYGIDPDNINQMLSAYNLGCKNAKRGKLARSYINKVRANYLKLNVPKKMYGDRILSTF